MLTGAGSADADALRQRATDFLLGHDPGSLPRLDFLRARFDDGLAWVHYPPGLGGLGLPRSLQSLVDAEFAAAGAPDNEPIRNTIGLGMAAATIVMNQLEGHETERSQDFPVEVIVRDSS